MRRRDGAAELTLTIDESRVRLSGSGVEVVAEHRGVSAALAEAVRGLAGARARLTTRHQRAAAMITPGFPPTPQAVGLLLAESFLPVPVADELARVIADAESCWVPVRLGMVVDGELRALPWEALPAPGTGRPLALHPLVTVYRRQQEAPPVPAAPGPLRILIAAVRGARQSHARVRVVHFATTAEINAALRQEPVHVLHLSGHGAPGLLELEDGKRPAGHHRSVRHRSRPARADATGDRAGRVSHRRRCGGGSVVRRPADRPRCERGDRHGDRGHRRLRHPGIHPDLRGAGRRRGARRARRVADARRTVQQELQGSPDEGEQRLGALGEWAVLA